MYDRGRRWRFSGTIRNARRWRRFYSRFWPELANGLTAGCCRWLGARNGAIDRNPSRWKRHCSGLGTIAIKDLSWLTPTARRSRDRHVTHLRKTGALWKRKDSLRRSHQRGARGTRNSFSGSSGLRKHRGIARIARQPRYREVAYCRGGGRVHRDDDGKAAKIIAQESHALAVLT